MKIKYAWFALLIFIINGIVSATACGESIVYKQVDTADMKIALTFDDGPHPFRTEEILNVLDKHGVKATFFIVGSNALNYPDTLRRVVECGHEVANHTFSHKLNSNTSKKDIINELNETSNIIIDICECEVKYFRPPGGCISKNVLEAAEECGYQIVLWNIDTLDWTNCEEEKITENVYKKIKSGSIILFHDYVSNKSHTVSSLDKIIPKLISEGYSFVTVGELLEYSQR